MKPRKKLGFKQIGGVLLLLAGVMLAPPSAFALKLQYFGETSIKTGTVFRDSKIGGLSALIYQNGNLWALSDDKGYAGDPRFYEFDLKIGKDRSVGLTPKEVHYFKAFPAPRGEKTIIDPEGFVRLPDGEFIISSECNNDRKPRIMPRLFRTKADGEYVSDLSLPDKFLPESLGQQKKGLQNNAAFEGLTQTEDGKYIYAAAEDSVVTDLPENDDTDGHWIRIVRFEKPEAKLDAKADTKTDAKGKEYIATAEYAYRVDPYSLSKDGKEVFRGVSEILSISDKKLVVLERGVRLASGGWTQTVALYEADLSTAQDVSNVKSLSTEKVNAVTKKKILDFETDLLKQRPQKKLQNFEGLAWGPVLPDGKKSLLVIADNNFSKKELTELLVFSVEAP